MHRYGVYIGMFEMVGSEELMAAFQEAATVRHKVSLIRAMQLIERGFVAAWCTGLPHAVGRSYVRARNIADALSLSWDKACRTGH
jgi:hypothetical protein